MSTKTAAHGLAGMRPRVLLVNLPYVVQGIDSNRPKIRSFLAVPYGLLSIATFNTDITDIRVFDCDATPSYGGALAGLIQEFKPDIVGFSMMFDNSFAHLRKLAALVKSLLPSCTVILGGAAASYAYEEILLHVPEIEAVCFSEGELPLRELLLMQDFGSSWARRDYWSPDRIVTPTASPISDLDSVIDLDYSFIDPAAYNMQQAFSPYIDYAKEHKQFFISTTRGCPFKCTFCSNSALHGKKMRFASVEAVVIHVRKLVEEYGMDVLTIYDDQFLLDTKRAKKLFRRLARFNLRIEMPNGLSVRYIDAEMADLMRRAGVDTVYLAVETGSEYVLTELIRKPLKLHQVEPAVKALRNADFFIHGFFVFGMPGETKQHRRETYDFMADIDLDWYGMNMATPVRGSKLYDDCIRNGWIQKQPINEIVDKKYIINWSKEETAYEIEREVYEFNLRFNFHNNRRMRLGDYDTAAACFREVTRRYEGHEVAKNLLKCCEEKLNVD